MTALAAELMLSQEKWTRKQLPMVAGVKAWKNGTCVADVTNGAVRPGKAGASWLLLGVFAETIDNTAGPTGTLVNVDFLKEKSVLWRANDGSITAGNLFSPCYVVDDQTVTLTSSGNTKAGTILAVSTVDGVAFEVEGV